MRALFLVLVVLLPLFCSKVLADDDDSEAWMQVTITEGEVEASLADGERLASINGAVCRSPLRLLKKKLSNVHYFAATASLRRTVAAYNSTYTWQGEIGTVAVNTKKCACDDGTVLVAVHYVHNHHGDCVLTADQAEIKKLTADQVYKDFGVEFYCSPTPNKCGATLPLYRMVSPTNRKTTHFYTTSAATKKTVEASKFKQDKIVCYIWPQEITLYDL